MKHADFYIGLQFVASAGFRWRCRDIGMRTIGEAYITKENITQLAGTSNAISAQFTYISDYNQLALMTDPLGHTTTCGYTNGCLTKVTDALSHSTTIQCNSAGQPTSLQDALGNTTTLAYQGYDLQSMTDTLGRTTTYVVDTLGRRVATKDPLGNVTLVQYDTNDRPTQFTDALNQITSTTYDGNGNALTVTLPNTAVLTSTYDTRNRRITRTDALNHSESWTYDGMNHVLSHTDRKGQVTDYTYDALNRTSLVSYADGSGIQGTYDAGNRLTELTDSIAGTLSWSYDGLDRVTSAVTPQGTVSYSYDAASRRIGMIPASQAAASYTYDAANRLTTLTQGSETVQLGYDADNRRTALTLPNGIVTAYGYDIASQLTAISYTQGNGTSLGNITYSYDLDGRRIGKAGTLATDIAPTPTTQAPTFDLNDRETSFNGNTLTYDANGNLTSDGTNTYAWNARNELTQITSGGATQMSYTYDALGRRISKAAQGGTPTQFLYDGANAVQETVGSTVNPILIGPGVDERYARNDVTGRTYFLTDALNSTIALTSSTGAIQNQYSYDPYGNVTASNATFTNPYQYTGREADSPGLYYYRARYYSPMMGGFISEDPTWFAGGQKSFYAYVGGAPISYSDPFGLKPGDPFNSATEAATDALNSLRGPTASNSEEYAGLIYQSGSSYYATTPVAGDYHTSHPFNPTSAEQVVSNDGTVAGMYHTHPYIHMVNGKPTPGNSQNTDFYTECFSQADIDLANRAAAKYHPFTSFLGTPTGILSYTPSSGAFTQSGY